MVGDEAMCLRKAVGEGFLTHLDGYGTIDCLSHFRSDVVLQVK